MAQFGAHFSTGIISLNELGTYSGPGGLIGAIISGYPYDPISETAALEDEDPVTAVVLDRVKAMYNVTNTAFSGERSRTNVIDMYVCCQISEGDVPVDPYTITTVSVADSKIVYIPCHLITTIRILPATY